MYAYIYIYIYTYTSAGAHGRPQLHADVRGDGQSGLARFLFSGGPTPSLSL